MDGIDPSQTSGAALTREQHESLLCGHAFQAQASPARRVATLRAVWADLDTVPTADRPASCIAHVLALPADLQPAQEAGQSDLVSSQTSMHGHSADRGLRAPTRGHELVSITPF